MPMMRFVGWWAAALCVATFMVGDARAQSDNAGGSSDDKIIEFINQQIKQGWEDNEVKPSVLATDGEWVRRLFLDTIGRIPTLQEVEAFTADKSPDKRAKIVDRLLNSEEYEMEFARNWTTFWTNLLIGRTANDDDDRPVNRAGMQQFLRTSILRNMPYNKFVEELVGANGSNTPGEENYNGATNFILDNLQEMQVPATTKVSQLFLGMRIGCTQCHNHPFNDWKQNQFWSFNAFFKQARGLRKMDGRELVSVTLEDQDFAGEGGDPEEAEIYYDIRNGTLEVAYPVFVDGTKISPVGYVSEVNRRDELAKLIAGSRQMRLAIVNRIWGHYFGYAFTRPVDDMGPHNAPSHPELLERLADEFGNYGYDMRRLMKWYLLSQPYALSSKMNKDNLSDDPSKGETPWFSHFYIRQMTAEQLYESLMAATQVDKTGKNYEEQEKLKSTWLQQFSIAFGTDENDEATTFNGTIPQALMMMNGELMEKALACQKGDFLHTVATSADQPSRKVAKLYLAALGRAPSSAESNAAVALAKLRGGDGVGAMQDVWWALLNSNEFIINH